MQFEKGDIVKYFYPAHGDYEVLRIINHESDDDYKVEVLECLWNRNFEGNILSGWTVLPHAKKISPAYDTALWRIINEKN